MDHFPFFRGLRLLLTDQYLLQVIFPSFRVDSRSQFDNNMRLIRNGYAIQLDPSSFVQFAVTFVASIGNVGARAGKRGVEGT